ncbi:hypothetical protein [Amedibacillus sp. YH-ame10]
MKKESIKKIKLIALILIILCNLGTLFYVAPLKENLSYLGNELGHKFYLILWGASAGLYFYSYTYTFMKRTSYSSKLGKLLLLIACLGMMISVLLPYHPTSYPELSKWHIRIAMWATALYVAVFFHYLFDLMKKDFVLFEKSMSLYGLLVSFDLVLFMVYGSVSSLLEITFTIGMAILLFWMDVKQGTNI